MSQTFHVVCCVNCKKFQNHIVKRVSNKWTCKICNTKQTLLKVFGEGTGAECRKIVQALNLASGKFEESVTIAKAIHFSETENGDEECEVQTFDSCTGTPVLTTSPSQQPSIVPTKLSRWAKYSTEEPEDI